MKAMWLGLVLLAAGITLAAAAGGPALQAFVAHSGWAGAVTRGGSQGPRGTCAAAPLLRALQGARGWDAGRRRCLMVLASSAEDRTADDGDVMPTRKKKAVPKHVEEVLQAETLVDNVLESVPSVQDFVPQVGEDRTNAANARGEAPVYVRNELYVRGIPWEMEEGELLALFREHGAKRARVMKDKEGKRALGFGFVRFASESAAQKAMGAMQGRDVPKERGGSTKLSISVATQKKTSPAKNRVLTSRAGREEEKRKVRDRAAELAERDKNKVVTSIEGMPRRFRQLADRNPEMLEALEGADLPHAGRLGEEEVMDHGDADERAARLVDMFKEGGNKIEEVSERQLKRERDDEEDDEVADLLYGELDDDDDEGDWSFIADGSDATELAAAEAAGDVLTVQGSGDLGEETEEERADWEAYLKRQREGGGD